MLKRNKYLAALALPLVFAMPAHGSPKSLEKISSDSSISFNQALSNPDYKEISVPTAVNEDTLGNKYKGFGTETYDITACIGDVFDLEKVRYIESGFHNLLYVIVFIIFKRDSGNHKV